MTGVYLRYGIVYVFIEGHESDLSSNIIELQCRPCLIILANFDKCFVNVVCILFVLLPCSYKS